MGDFFRNMVKELGDEAISILDDGTNSSEFSGFLDTGSYTLNIAFSGRTRGGIPNNKTSALAGVSGVGKTYILLGIVKTFLDSDQRAGVMAFETEGATTKAMAQSRGIDTKRVIVAEPSTLQDFRNKTLKALSYYENIDEDKRPPLMFTLDSLGQLPTAKELEDSLIGNDVKDMTRSQIVRSIFRVLDLKLGRLKVPMILTNHTYTNIMAYGAPQVASGGGGVQYAADQIVMLTKKKLKDGAGKDTEVVGNEITVKINKSRLTRENESVTTRILYDGGLDRFYGLTEMCLDAGIWKKVGNKIELTTGDTVFEKAINEDPATYLTTEILDRIDEYASKKYMYGANADLVAANAAAEQLLTEELQKAVKKKC